MRTLHFRALVAIISLVCLRAGSDAAPVPSNVDACAVIATFQTALVAGRAVEHPRVLTVAVVNAFAYITYNWGNGSGPALLLRERGGWRLIKAGGGEMPRDIIVAFGESLHMPAGTAEELIRSSVPPPSCVPAPLATATPVPLPSVVPTKAVTHVQPTHVPPPRGNAPVEETFGTYPMTVLGIHNHAVCLARRFELGGSATEFDHADLIVSAIRDLEQQYPRDVELPRDIYLMEVAYAKAHTNEGRTRVDLMRAWLRTRYSKSREARLTPKAVEAADPGLCHMGKDVFPTSSPR